MANQGKVKRRNQVRKGPHGGMQLVLCEDVPHLGKQGDVVEVKPGYGRNYLVPRGLAVVPTEHNLRLLERHKVRVQQAREARIADLKSLAEQIQRIPGITIEANAHEETGHLYGSVGAAEIARGLRAKGLMVEPEMVKLEGGPIKEVALYAVKLNLGYDIETEVKVAVIRAQEKK
ncbi:MAG TPA: 50S ribosomal protein L9 [Gemmataceae bacterium]|nr:50S ribosomal protein L9 [Gemmataceae bacterium]